MAQMLFLENIVGVLFIAATGAMTVREVTAAPILNPTDRTAGLTGRAGAFAAGPRADAVKARASAGKVIALLAVIRLYVRGPAGAGAAFRTGTARTDFAAAVGVPMSSRPIRIEKAARTSCLIRRWVDRSAALADRPGGGT